MSSPQNAILAKVRTMYSRSLSVNKYNEMMKKTSVTEVAVYLRDNTPYGEFLQNINLNDIHREQLLELLQNAKFTTFQKLARFSFSKNDDGFYSYLYRLEEAKSLLKHIRYVCSGSQELYDFSYNKLLMEHSSFDYNKLLSIKTYDGITEFMHGTIYESILIKNRRQDAREIDTVKIETEIFNTMYAKLGKNIRKEFSHKESQGVIDMFIALNDMQSIVKAYRLKKFFNANNEYIESVCYPHTKKSQRIVKEIANTKDNEKLEIILKDWEPVKNFGLNKDYIEDCVVREKARLCNKNIHFSVYPSLTLLCYILHLDIELENIANIVEGIRYGISEGEIKDLLIY